MSSGTYNRAFDAGVQESMPLDHWIVAHQPGRSELAVRLAEQDTHSATRMVAASWTNPVKKLFLPLAIAASFGGPVQPQEIKRAFLWRSGTPLVKMRWELDDEYWEPTAQLITNEQVRALNELLATPYIDSPSIGQYYDG
jgi:hypothetical protein